MNSAKPAIAGTAQIRELDRRAIEEYGLSGLVLMENAGRGAAQIVLEMLPSPESQKVWILCGKGNNGGDGFVIARHLHNASVSVEVVLAANIDDVGSHTDAGANLHVALKMDIPIRTVRIARDAVAVSKALGSADVIIDALLGTGSSGEVREPVRTLIEAVNASGRPVLSVDTPSGLCTDSGRVLGVAVSAHRTATFAAAKKGFFTGEGPEHVGRLDLVDIGVPRQLLEGLG